MLISRAGRGVIKPKPGARINYAHPLARGLVGYWPLNEGAGSQVNDVIKGDSGTLTMASDPAFSGWTGSPQGGGVRFNGGTDEALTSNNPTTATDNLSIVGWMNPEVLSTLGIACNNGGGSDGYGFGIGDGSGGAGDNLIGLLGGVAWLNSGFTFPSANRWYHVVMLRDAGTWKFYVNAVQTATTSTTTPNAPTGNFSLGSDSIRFFRGVIDGGGAYNRVLSEPEIKQHYVEPQAMFLRSSLSPIVYVPTVAGLLLFDEPHMSGGMNDLTGGMG